MNKWGVSATAMNDENDLRVALEEVFGLDIDSSDSDLELAPVDQSIFLQSLHSQLKTHIRDERHQHW